MVNKTLPTSGYRYKPRSTARGPGAAGGHATRDRLDAEVQGLALVSQNVGVVDAFFAHEFVARPLALGGLAQRKQCTICSPRDHLSRCSIKSNRR